MSLLIVSSKVRALAKEKGKRVSPEFIEELNRRMTNKIIAACAVHNGGKKTLDAFIAGYIFGGGSNNPQS